MVTCKQAASALARCGKGRVQPRPLKGTAKRKRRFTLLDDDPDEPVAVQTPLKGKRVNARRVVPVPPAPGSLPDLAFAPSDGQKYVMNRMKEIARKYRNEGHEQLTPKQMLAKRKQMRRLVTKLGQKL